MSIKNFSFFVKSLTLAFFVNVCYYFFAMNKEGKIFWLERRLSELGKTKRDFAHLLGVSQSRFNDLEAGKWRFQAAHISKAAKFLEFDRMAFLDFVSGEISEDELWKAEPPIKITQEDLALLKAVKTVAARPQTTTETSDLEVSRTISAATKEKER